MGRDPELHPAELEEPPAAENARVAESIEPGGEEGPETEAEVEREEQTGEPAEE